MHKETLSVGFAVALGSLIGGFVALDIAARFAYGTWFWGVGALLGGCIAWFAIDFRQLCSGIARSYRTNTARFVAAYRDVVMLRMNEAISNMERAKLLQMLDAAEVPVGPVNDVAEILADPQVRARGLVGSFDYPGVGEFKALGLPYRFLGWDNPAVGAPPELGADTERILAEKLGYSGEKIAALRAAEAI